MKKLLQLSVFSILLLTSCEKESNSNEATESILSTGTTLEDRGAKKVTICHKTGNGSYVSLSVNQNAVAAHLAHGDYLPDSDGDGFTAIGACTGSKNDCDDTNAAIHPGAVEICDNIDNNCDGDIDEGTETTSYYADADEDGYGDFDNAVTACSPPAGYILQGGDCDDTNPNINPDAIEVCGDVDLNCDGEGLPSSSYYPDADGDGFGDLGTAVTDCSQPEGYVALGGDCDDSDPLIHPEAAELCNDELDNDCDGDVDEDCPE